MQKYVSLPLIGVIFAILSACTGNPVCPDSYHPAINVTIPDPYTDAQSAYDGPYRLWGEWEFYFDASHESVRAVPRRQARFHLNALKFVEDYCEDCLEITNLHNNGDSTVDLTVKLKHPFEGYPEYTGFDVKGIIMFDGSWTNPGYQFYLPYPEPFRVSWRKLGDPQVLNADGYTLRWSPWYESGQSQPIFNYYEGKYSNGTPGANLNAYLDFYTHEERHMFFTNGVESRTYHIWLPPGQPVVAGYAVEACWEPPLVTPVTNPADDFPLTANQAEAYDFRFDINNGEPITDPDCCGILYDPTEGYFYSKQWGGHTANMFAIYSDCYHSDGANLPSYGDEWPDCYCSTHVMHADIFPDGDYIAIAINYGKPGPPYHDLAAYTLSEFTIDLE